MSMSCHDSCRLQWLAPELCAVKVKVEEKLKHCSQALKRSSDSSDKAGTSSFHHFESRSVQWGLTNACSAQAAILAERKDFLSAHQRVEYGQKASATSIRCAC